MKGINMVNGINPANRNVILNKKLNKFKTNTISNNAPLKANEINFTSNTTIIDALAYEIKKGISFKGRIQRSEEEILSESRQIQQRGEEILNESSKVQQQGKKILSKRRANTKPVTGF